MYLSRHLLKATITTMLVWFAMLPMSGTIFAEVYVNMLWNEDKEEFDIQTLVLEGQGITFDRDYQNAYGEINDLEPGPPFFVEASILASSTYKDDGTVDGWGTISFESGGIGLLSQPFVIYVSDGGTGNTGQISADGGVNFIGSFLDPIRIEGIWKIESGYRGGSDPQGQGQHSSTWLNTEFLCTFNQDVWNHAPIIFRGSNVQIENCLFSGFNEDFSNLLSFNDVYTTLPDPVWTITLRNNRFQNLQYSDTWNPFSLQNLKQVTIENNHFQDFQTLEDNDLSALIRVDDCGIASIRNNSGSGNTWNIIQLVDTWATGAAMIHCDSSLSIRSTAIHIPADSLLMVEPQSVIKFHETSGGFYVEGDLIADSVTLTSCLDDTHGANACYPPQSGPFPYRWYTEGGAGIGVDTTGTATITNSRIMYARGGIRAFGELSLDNTNLSDCSDFGIVLQGAGALEYHLSNTEIVRISNTASPWSAAIFYENRSGTAQALHLDSCRLVCNEMDGVEVFYIGEGPTTISLDGCELISNFGYGFVFPVDPMLSECQVTNSLVLGNAYGGLVGLDNSGTANPMRFENNVIIGNGHGASSSYRHGISIPAGSPHFVGNTVAYNYQYGIGMYQIDTIEHSHVANNLFFRNGDYGFIKTDYDDPLFANNNFWQNDDGNEIRYRGPSGYLYTVEEVQALGGEFAANLHVDPIQIPEIYGAIDSIKYDESGQISKLIDSDFPASGLKNRAICPDTTNVDWYYILGHIADTVWIAGDITGKAVAGDTYRIYDFHLTDASPMIDAGRNTSVTLLYDLEGDARYIDGDNDLIANVDIGADEFDPDAGIEAPVRVLKPDSSSLYVSYDSVTIKYRVVDSISQVDIAYTYMYDETHPNDNWETVATGVDASSGEYRWQVPAGITISDCRVKVTATSHTSLSGVSEPFDMKHLGLTRLIDEAGIIDYAHPDNSWSFGNDSATMWPDAVWPDYLNDLDTITGFQYPIDFARVGPSDSDFPSWPTFVEAFGVDACYFNSWTGRLYKPSAVLRWGAIKGNWRGSCFGLALTDLMAFVDSAAFAARNEVGPFASLNSLAINDDLRRLINRFYAHQFGGACVTHTAEARQLSVRETLNELRETFQAREASNSDRILTLCDTSSVNSRGCHAVTPYYLHLTNPADSIWHLSIYDNNLPAEYPVIEIDQRNDRWTYTPLGLEGDRLLFLENPLSDFGGDAELSPAGSSSVPVARGIDLMEIYIGSADSVQLSFAGGAVGYYGDSAFNELDEASPIIPRGGKGEPIGYYLRDGDWTCRIGNATGGEVSLTEFDGGNIVSYRRTGSASGETDLLSYDGEAMTVRNPDDADRTCALDFVITEPTGELSFRIGEYLIASGDSLRLKLTSGHGLCIANYGGASVFDLTLQHASDSGLFAFGLDSVHIAADCEQHFEPEWPEVNTDSVRVLIDYGIDGVIDDTVYLQNEIVTGADEGQGALLPYRFELSQNYPNPFNPVTTMEYTLPRRSHVTIDIYNVLGQRVRTLVDRDESAGTYTITWDGTTNDGQPAATGVYLYRFQAGEHVDTKKMLLLK